MASTLLAGGAAALAIGVTTPSAAATSLTVAISAGGSFTASAASVVFHDGSVSVTCSAKGSTPAGSASFSVPDGTHKGAAPVSIGTRSKAEFNNCTGPLGAVTITPLHEPYHVEVDSVTNGSGDTDYLFTGVDAHISMTDCTFTVTGSTGGYYSNSTHTLAATPTPPITPLVTAKLTVSKVSGCLGVVHNGDHTTVTATSSPSPATLVIKSS